jgi:hypothetical protein
MIPQHTWVSKLFGYDFKVEFNPEGQNAATDVLSRHDENATIITTCTLSRLNSICSMSSRRSRRCCWTSSPTDRRLTRFSLGLTGRPSMALSYTVVASSFQAPLHYGLSSSPQPMTLAMRVPEDATPPAGLVLQPSHQLLRAGLRAGLRHLPMQQD